MNNDIPAAVWDHLATIETKDWWLLDDLLNEIGANAEAALRVLNRERWIQVRPRYCDGGSEFAFDAMNRWFSPINDGTADGDLSVILARNKDRSQMVYAIRASEQGKAALAEQELAREATSAQTAEPEQPDGDATQGEPGKQEITLAAAAREFDVPAAALSRARKKPADSPGHLPTRESGSNVFVRRDHAKTFAANYNARKDARFHEKEAAIHAQQSCAFQKTQKNHRNAGTPKPLA